MRVGRWLRWLAAVVGTIGAWLVLVAAGSGVTIGLMVLPLLPLDSFHDDRHLERYGRHGNLIVHQCQPDSGEWVCTGRFVSDDTEVTVENLAVHAEDRPGELVPGWIHGPDDTELVTELTLVPGWVVTTLTVVAFVIYSVGLMASFVVAGKLARRAWRRWRPRA